MVDIIAQIKSDNTNLTLIPELVTKGKMPDINVMNLIDNFNKDYEWTPPRLVKIPKPGKQGKFRDIFIFKDEDSYLLKVIASILNQFDNLVHKDVYSYRKGLRTFNAAKHIQQALTKNMYGVKLDISDYFGSVNKETIFNVVDKLDITDDDKYMLKQIFSIDKYYFQEECLEKPLGIMAGSAISAFFANIILKPIDTLVSHKAVVYARYSDDLLYFTKTKEEADYIFTLITNLLAPMGLSINPKKVQYFNTADDVVDFLGLYITRESIDINNTSFTELKKLVKSKVKQSRDVQSAIRKLNKLLYKNIFIPKTEHLLNRMHYTFSSITTDKTIKELDYYTVNTLRAKMTGKHNKANWRIPVSDLEAIGYRSAVQLWNLYKASYEAYLNEVDLLNYRYEPTPIPYDGLRLHVDTSTIAFKTVTVNTFKELYEIMLGSKDNYFILNNTKVYPEYLQFDIVNKFVLFSNIKLIEGKRLLLNVWDCFIQGQYLRVKITQGLCSCKPDSQSNLMLLYLQATYRTELNQRVDVSPSSAPINKYFRTYKVNEIMRVIGETVISKSHSYPVRWAKFISYFYFQVVSKAYWSDLELNQQFNCVSAGYFTLVIKRQYL